MDLQKPQTLPVVSAVQTDRYSRNLEISLYANEKFFPIPEDTAVVIRYKKFDGKGGEYDTLPDGSCAWSSEGNTLTIALAPQALTAPGIVEVSVSLIAGEQQLSTFPIQINVQPIARAGIAKSENYFYVTGLLTAPSSAKVGQYLQIESVSQDGKVTGIKAVDLGADTGGEPDPVQVQQIVAEYLAQNPPIAEESDPNVPDWAKQAEKPSYSAADVGADAWGTAEAAVTGHNESANSHADIRAHLHQLSSEIIPDYVVAEADSVIDRVIAAQGPRTFTFAAVTDLHFGNGGYTDGVRHACQALKYIDSRIKLDAVAVLGDYTDGYPDADTENAFGDLKAVNRLLQDLRFAPNLRQQGNHDYCSNAPVIHRFIQAHSMGVVWGDKPGGYYYRDFEPYKLRVISVNTSENGNDFVRCSDAQYNWFASALDLSAKENAGEWQILILSHHPLDWYVESEYVFCYVLDAYKKGTSWSNSSGTISCDFTGGKNAAVLIGNIHGHIHNLKTDYLHFGNVNGGNKTDIYRMCTPEVCINRENQYSGVWAEETSYPKSIHSAKDTSLTIYCLDLDAYTNHAICYGAGYDRVLSYINSFTVINSLTNVISSNPQASVVAGNAYSADLSPADGYKINGISVTMDGVDITGTAVEGSKIHIGTVTGDVRIEATAVINLINLIDTVGYQDNTRLSTSSGEFREKSGYVTTGEILLEAEGDVYRTSGVNFNADAEYDRGICVYQAQNITEDHSYWMFLNSYAAQSPLTMSGNVGTVEIDSDGNLKITTGSGWCNEVAGAGIVGRKIRLVGCGTGADLLVTKNQEIPSF